MINSVQKRPYLFSKVIIWAVVLWFLPAMWSYAQTTPPSDSAALGLALSGGGAKGIAHIGVLQALEEQGIRPRYLTGTSIGAIVGAYYVAGYTPQQILDMFRRTDFDALMTDQIPRRFLPLYLKRTGRNSFFHFPVDMHRLQLKLPGGLTHSQLFYNQLFRDLYNIQYLPSFDSLPVRARFYATDLVTGKSVAFKSGSIPRAVVASSALPSIVSPLLIDGKILTDGGVVNNYPLEGLYRMGARKSIGSDVQGQLLRESQIQSIKDILDQITSIYMYADMPQKRRKTDVYIRPPVSRFSVTDFELIDTLYRLGYETTIAQSKKLSSFKPYTNRRPMPQPGRPDSLYIGNIEIRGLKIPKAKQYFEWRTNIREGHKVGFDQFLEGINYLYGTGDYRQIHYWITPGDTLIVDIVPDTVRFKLRTAVHYMPLFQIEFLAGLTGRQLLSPRDRADLEIIFGPNIRYNFDYLIDNGYHLGLGFHSSYHRFDRTVDYHLMLPRVQHPSFRTMGLHVSVWTNRLFFQNLMSNSVNLHLGAEMQTYRVYTTVFSGNRSNRKFFFDHSTYYAGFMNFYYDDLDDYNFSMHGVKIQFDYKYIFGISENYAGVKPFHNVFLELSGYRKHNAHFSTSYEFKAGLNTSDTLAPSFYYYFGGTESSVPFSHIVPFYGRDYLSFRSPAFLMLQPQLQWKVGQNHHFYLGMQGLIYTEGPVYEEKFRRTYSVYGRYGFESYFGPIFVTLGWEPLFRQWHAGLSIGFRF